MHPSETPNPPLTSALGTVGGHHASVDVAEAHYAHLGVVPAVEAVGHLDIRSRWIHACRADHVAGDCETAVAGRSKVHVRRIAGHGLKERSVHVVAHSNGHYAHTVVLQQRGLDADWMVVWIIAKTQNYEYAIGPCIRMLVYKCIY